MTALPLSGQFTMVDPTHVAEVGATAALLYGRILWRAQQTGGVWRATRRQLRDETGLSEATLRTAVKVLRDQEWVATDRTSTDDATLVWQPLGPCDLHEDDSTPPPAESAPPPAQSGGTPPAKSSFSSLETGKDITPSPADAGALFDQTPAAPPLRSVPTPSELDAEFARFWALYPRKTGKKAARAAYARARRDTSVQQIATGLRSQLPGMLERIAAGEDRFVVHPTTWLNQGRWEDEVRPQVVARNVYTDTEYDPEWERQQRPPVSEPRSWATRL